MDKLMKLLGDAITKEVNDSMFTHYDFIFNPNTKDLLYNDIISNINKHSGNVNFNMDLDEDQQ